MPNKPMSANTWKTILTLVLFAFAFFMHLANEKIATLEQGRTYKEGLQDGFRITVACTIDLHKEGHTYELVRKCVFDELADINVTVIEGDGK